jgi:hypothetical protein
MNFSWPPITFQTPVIIMAAEAKFLGPSLIGRESEWATNRGEADVYVTNVGPSNGHVEFILHVNWPQPLDIITDIIVLDPRESFHIAE